MRLVLLLTLVTSLPATAQSVFVVDATGAGDFTALQPAIDAAANGDVILVRTSLAVGAAVTTIDGKGLTVIGDAVAHPDVAALSVINLPAGATVTLRHLASISPLNHFQAIEARDSLGTVVLEDVMARGQSAGPFILSAAGLRTVHCDAVVLNLCTLQGGTAEAGSGGVWPALPALPALLSEDSRVSATWTDFQGGAGASGGFFGVGYPGDGIQATGGYLHLSRATVKGGANPTCDTTCSGIPGSDGLQLEGGFAQFIDSTFEAPPGNAVTVEGEDIDAAPGTVQDLGGTRRALLASALVREFQKGLLIYEGVAHDRVAILVSMSGGFAPLPSKLGVWQLLDPVAGPEVIGVADAEGHLKIAFHAPEVPPLQGFTLLMQAAVQESGTGKLRISGPTTCTVLDSAF
jgi:hypothetical protein